MGTNYYHCHKVCKCCDRYDRLAHIGKSSYGWTFSFHGFRDADDYGNPYGRPVVSWADWKQILAETKNAQIRDEYGKEWSLDDFIAKVEGKKAERNNHTLYSRVHHPGHAARDCWLDEEGNGFSAGEFC